MRQGGCHVVDPAWGHRYDVGLGEFTDSPMPPAPPQFIDAVREFMPGRGARGAGRGAEGG